TWSAVLAGSQARLLHTQALPRLGLRAWKERLLNAVADRCVRQSRRDPRDSAEAEQGLYEQLDEAMENARLGQPIELTIQSAHWFQGLTLRDADLLGACAALL